MNNKHKPDLTAPRFRNDSINTLENNYFLKYFRKKHPELNHVSDKTLRNIIKTFNEIEVKNVIDNRYGVELPWFTGRIFIGSCFKKLKPNIDFNKTIYSNAIVQHRNLESDNYLAKIFYSTYNIKHAYKNSQLYSFKGCRNFTRLVGATYPINWKKYMTVEKFQKISGLYKQSMSRLERQDQTEDYLLTYDEFEF